MTLTDFILEALTLEYTYNTPGAAVSMLHLSTGRSRCECRHLLAAYQQAASAVQPTLLNEVGR